MRNTIEVLGVNVDKVTMHQALKKVDSFMQDNEKLHSIYTPNPEIIMLAQEDKEFLDILNQADLVIPDGIGVVIASKLLKGPKLPERVPGYDLVQNMLQYGVQKDYKYYFFGSKPQVADLAAEKMRKKYPGIQIVGTHDGYFKQEDEKNIIDDINKSGANVLLVALGAPKQEKWIVENAERLYGIKVAIGVGGSLDGMADIVKRAPAFFQKIGLEWFYRLAMQPTRWKRMLVIPKFIVKVLTTKK